MLDVELYRAPWKAAGTRSEQRLGGVTYSIEALNVGANRIRFDYVLY